MLWHTRLLWHARVLWHARLLWHAWVLLHHARLLHCLWLLRHAWCHACLLRHARLLRHTRQLPWRMRHGLRCLSCCDWHLPWNLRHARHLALLSTGHHHAYAVHQCHQRCWSRDWTFLHELILESRRQTSESVFSLRIQATGKDKLPHLQQLLFWSGGGRWRSLCHHCGLCHRGAWLWWCKGSRSLNGRWRFGCLSHYRRLRHRSSRLLCLRCCGRARSLGGWFWLSRLRRNRRLCIIRLVIFLTICLAFCLFLCLLCLVIHLVLSLLVVFLLCFLIFLGLHLLLCLVRCLCLCLVLGLLGLFLVCFHICFGL
mmetsp:Transcript_156688/g.276745  ORF Transcript_156688/g.276745 Transcript_156688/m.276745 type:complete len:313 (+) Transcript_156688:2217-3155(+)